jgi:zinc transport system substrate-binding protein
MKKLHILISIVLLTSLYLGACQSQNQAVQTEEPSNIKPVVFVSIVPQKYFVERIAGDSVDVVVMVEPGAEPHTYEPKPAQMTALANADVYFSIDAPFEATWLDKIEDINPELPIINTAEGITKRVMTEEHHHEGEEESTEEHEEEGELDPHIWLSPRLVAIQAKAIHAELVTLIPEQKDVYDANLTSFLTDIEALDASLKEGFANVSSHTFMVYHPSWGYFADDYGLTQVSVEIGGTEPSASELAEVIDEAKEHDIHVIFAQPEFSTRSAETVAEEINGKVAMISPLAENWLENMKTVGEVLAEGLK